MPQRVLIIDDVPDILMLVTLSLEAVGFVALTSSVEPTPAWRHVDARCWQAPNGANMKLGVFT